MQQKLETRAFEQVAPLLQDGEKPLAGTRVVVGKFSSGPLRLAFGAPGDGVALAAALGHAPTA